MSKKQPPASEQRRLFSGLVDRLTRRHQPGTSARRFLHAVILIGLMLAVAAAAIVMQPGGAGTPIPQPDLSNVHSNVAASVATARAQVEEHPMSDERWGHLGMVYMAHEWYAEARACFLEAARLGPQEFRWAYYQAVLRESDNLAAAASAYAQAEAMRPNYVPLRCRWASVLLRLGDFEGAEKQFREASRLAPREAVPQIGLGRMARSQHDLEAARGHFETAVALSPSSRDARAELASVYHLLGQEELAVNEQQRAAALAGSYGALSDPFMQDVEKLANAARHLSMQADQLAMQGHLPAAEQAYRKLISDRPDLARARMNLAQVLLSQGRQSEALEEYRGTIELFPDDALAYFSYASTLEKLGRSETAIRNYEQAIRLKPDYSHAWYALGQLLEQTGDREGAANCYRQAVESDPQFAPAHLALGIALQAAPQLEGALSHFRTAVQLAPNDPVSRRHLESALQNRTEPARD
jgi:tetratricopeptide (TPR) repeat protein